MWGSLSLAPNNNYPELSFLCEGPLSIHVICILLTQLSIVLHSAFIIKSIGRGINYPYRPIHLDVIYYNVFQTPSSKISVWYTLSAFCDLIFGATQIHAMWLACD